MENIASIKKLLEKSNLKSTSMRLEVLSILYKDDRAFSLSEIQEKLNDFDRVTLYRTINSFLDHGIIHSAMRIDNDSYYALCSRSCTSETHVHNHIHFLCMECNNVSCVQIDNSPKISIPTYIIDSVEITAKGKCHNCNVS